MFGPSCLSAPRPLMPVLPFGFLMTDKGHIKTSRHACNVTGVLFDALCFLSSIIPVFI